MLGILRGSLVTSCCGIIGDFSADAKVKLRRIINEEGRSFSQLRDWAFLHTVATFNLADGTNEYSGSGYLPQGMQRMLAIKLKDSNNNYAPIDEKSLDWYSKIEDPTYEGTPYAIVLRGLDSSGYPIARFYFTPDATYTFEVDCTVDWTDVDETSTGDATRLIVTQDCLPAFKYWVSKAYAVGQGDGEVADRCDKQLYGNPMLRIPGLLDALFSKQRGVQKHRGVKPSSAYKDENRLTARDYGLRSKRW